MAHLKSIGSEVETSVELKAGDSKITDGQTWQALEITMVSGLQKITTKTLPNAHECMVCRLPKDEIKQLWQQLYEVLQSARKKVSFELQEPFFELDISHSKHQDLTVEAWLDSGSGINGIYSWDAAGVRFVTNMEQLKHFIEQLKAEFAC